MESCDFCGAAIDGQARGGPGRGTAGDLGAGALRGRTGPPRGPAAAAGARAASPSPSGAAGRGPTGPQRCACCARPACAHASSAPRAGAHGAARRAPPRPRHAPAARCPLPAARCPLPAARVRARRRSCASRAAVTARGSPTTRPASSATCAASRRPRTGRCGRAGGGVGPGGNGAPRGPSGSRARGAEAIRRQHGAAPHRAGSAAGGHARQRHAARCPRPAADSCMPARPLAPNHRRPPHPHQDGGWQCLRGRGSCYKYTACKGQVGPGRTLHPPPSRLQASACVCHMRGPRATQRHCIRPSGRPTALCPPSHTPLQGGLCGRG
jgi:hypothetical protein